MPDMAAKKTSSQEESDARFVHAVLGHRLEQRHRARRQEEDEKPDPSKRQKRPASPQPQERPRQQDEARADQPWYRLEQRLDRIHLVNQRLRYRKEQQAEVA